MTATEPAGAIRRARLQDAGPLARLATELGYPSAQAELEERLTALLGREDHLVLAAEVAGEVVGWVHVRAALQVESGAHAEVAGLVVAPSARGQGFGRRLVDAARAWARDQGLGQVRVRSNVVRADAHAFYLRLGFRRLKTQAVFSRPADGA